LLSIKIYHNPRCSKSRQTLKILEEQGIQPDIIDYLKNKPNKEELETVLTLLGMSPRDLMRKGETIYKELNLKDNTLSDEQLLNAMLENPILIERPIVLANGKAAIGRPPESVLGIL
jgi:arsenate reductase (glutaredoxin)